jgi:hypothetical protein
MMNRLFRNIAENRSLDALEESDDEEGSDDELTGKCAAPGASCPPAV